MATTHSAPIDLYEESREGFAEEGPTPAATATEDRRPAFNGERDDRACAQSNEGLERVLGW
jgi:hypothetical protein